MGILSGGCPVDLKRPERKPRVIVAKIGLDGHSRGAYVVAHGLRQAGMEVIYTGLRQTPSAVARAAVQESADVIGISSMVGAHLSMVKKLKKELSALNASDIPIILGGIIPEEDYDHLMKEGVNKIFPSGTDIKDIVHYIHSIMEEPTWVPEVPGSLIGDKIEDLHLLGTRCEKCGRTFFPSRRNCPRCLERQFAKSIHLSDHGKLKSFVVASVAPPGYEVPHIQGYVDLEGDGPRIFSILTDIGGGATLKTGLRMVLKVIKRGTDSEDRAIMGYRFRPID
jgi:methylmalonyl-CoA mutase C-terminal domain/subunit